MARFNLRSHLLGRGAGIYTNVAAISAVAAPPANAMTLDLVTAPTVNAVQFDLTFDSVTPAAGDDLTLQIDDNSGFTSPTEYTITLTSDIIADDQYDFGIAPVANGLTYFRVELDPLVGTTVYSNTVSETIAAPAPALTLPTSTNITSTTATIGASTSVGHGTLKVVVTNSTTAPSAPQRKAGQDHTGASVAAGRYGTQTVTTPGAKTQAITGLTAAGTWYPYWVHTDAAGNETTYDGPSFATSVAATSTTWTSIGKGANIALSSSDTIATKTTGGSGTTNSDVVGNDWAQNGGAENVLRIFKLTWTGGKINNAGFKTADGGPSKGYFTRGSTFADSDGSGYDMGPEFPAAIFPDATSGTVWVGCMPAGGISAMAFSTNGSTWYWGYPANTATADDIIIPWALLYDQGCAVTLDTSPTGLPATVNGWTAKAWDAA